MKRCIFWGYHSDDALAAVDNLVEAGELEVVAWFGNHARFGFNLDETVHQPPVLTRKPPVIREHYDRVFTHLETFLEQYSRVSWSKGKSYQELLHLFNLYYDYFTELLLRSRAETVLLSNLPHFGVDFMLYRCAEALGLRTVMSFQSHLSERFYYVYDLNDFGRFDAIDSYGAAPLRLSIPRSHKKSHFYMRDIRQKRKSCPLSLLNDMLRNALGKASKPMSLSGAFQKFLECRQYETMAPRATCEHVDLERPFVYFPLQLQPELTTSALGGRYCDQLLALERLSALLPEGWKIYAKENPKQTQRQRGEYFYRRLQSIKNVEYLPRDVDTHLLIEKSRFVSVVTGTAGWEAISGGKNVLIFGSAWYWTLPGVFHYEEGVDLDELLAYEIDHAALERAYETLMDKTAVGIMDMVYRPIVPDYDATRNVSNLEAFLRRVLA